MCPACHAAVSYDAKPVLPVPLSSAQIASKDEQSAGGCLTFNILDLDGHSLQLAFGPVGSQTAEVTAKALSICLDHARQVGQYWQLRDAWV